MYRKTVQRWNSHPSEFLIFSPPSYKAHLLHLLSLFHLSLSLPSPPSLSSPPTLPSSPSFIFSSLPSPPSPSYSSPSPLSPCESLPYPFTHSLFQIPLSLLLLLLLLPLFSFLNLVLLLLNFSFVIYGKPSPLLSLPPWASICSFSLFSPMLSISFSPSSPHNSSSSFLLYPPQFHCPLSLSSTTVFFSSILPLQKSLLIRK